MYLGQWRWERSIGLVRRQIAERKNAGVVHINVSGER